MARTAPRCIHQAVSAQAARHPGATALVYRGSVTDYGTLEAAADACAAELSRAGVRPGDIVPVILPRTPHLVLTLLAILKCGAAYAAFDRRWPAERVTSLLDLLRPPLVVTTGDSAAGAYRAWDPGERTVAGWAALRSEPVSQPIHVDGPATVFFTSGTTGTPKGVLSPHRATTRLFTGEGPLAFGPGRVMLQAAPPAWDAFSLELWGMLATGGTSVLAEDDHLLPHVLQRLIVDHGVNTAWLTASLFNLFVELEPGCFTGLRHVLTGGEKLSRPHVRQFLDEHPGISLTNGYGPVETCVFATCHSVGRPDLDAPDGIPLGRPVPETGIHVIDGEICVSGGGLALGYLGADEGSAERFVDRVIDGARVRVYRTGDRGRLDAGGVLHFMGRTDRQVKVRGYRIELAEIESVAGRLSGVGQCVAVPVPAPGGAPDSHGRLALFYTAGPSAESSAGSSAGPPVGLSADESDPLVIRERLAATLPRYAVPEVIQRVSRIPVTANGKTDAAALVAELNSH
jgi:D-alanine--poly(phosphoribitol) ligase subunit 1